MILGSVIWSNPWPVLVPTLATLFTVVLAVELVLSLVRTAVTADSAGGEDV